ncbi:hypothetical protein [Halapricum desulfuricans]|uniref:RHH/CopG DNA binding protein n=1 Tax=Halapricum desulfuricans TaxID=2841257 RepID=A0A897NT65_9EURY|nr:hypothetical protein [Halapricum desulfuricans]QSG15624.1 RHH/CopG DNA binding protein [Halapricum desulfuricans]
MVSKITIFEPHFEHAQFGPESIDTDWEGDTETEITSDGSPDSKSRFTMILQGATAFVVLFAVLWAVLSRLLSDEPESE